MTENNVLSRLGDEEMKISLTAKQISSEDESDYSSFFELAESAFSLNTLESLNCGDMVMTIFSDDSFISFNDATETVKLKPDLFHEAGVFTESKIQFSMSMAPYLSFNVTIEATIERCSVSFARFNSLPFQIEYFIGDADSQQPLPEIVQEPACNLPIDAYSFIGSST